MSDTTKIDWALFVGVLGALLGGAVWIGNLQGVVQTLNPEVIRENTEIAIQEIKQAGVEAKKYLNKGAANPSLETEKLFSGQEKLENSFKELQARVNVLADENNALRTKITSIKRVEGPPGSAERNYADKFSALEAEIENLKKEYKEIDGKLRALSAVDRNDYLEIKGLAENNRKELGDVQKKLEKMKNAPETASTEGYYKLPITPEEGKLFSPPLKKAITLCDEYFYLTYKGFWNKKSNAFKVSYTMSYDSKTTNEYIDTGEAKLFKGDDRKLILRYMSLSDDGENPIFKYECK